MCVPISTACNILFIFVKKNPERFIFFHEKKQSTPLYNNISPVYSQPFKQCKCIFRKIKLFNFITFVKLENNLPFYDAWFL